jgi:acyl-CoA synthetase (NDP forming)
MRPCQDGRRANRHRLHSRALDLALLDYVQSNNLGIAHFASIGTAWTYQAPPEFWEDDENTDVILLYLRPRQCPPLQDIQAGLPESRSSRSRRAGARSRGQQAHTGALAASDAVDALFRQAGSD